VGTPGVSGGPEEVEDGARPGPAPPLPGSGPLGPPAASWPSVAARSAAAPPASVSDDVPGLTPLGGRVARVGALAPAPAPPRPASTPVAATAAAPAAPPAASPSVAPAVAAALAAAAAAAASPAVVATLTELLLGAAPAGGLSPRGGASKAAPPPRAEAPAGAPGALPLWRAKGPVPGPLPSAAAPQAAALPARAAAPAPRAAWLPPGAPPRRAVSGAGAAAAPLGPGLDQRLEAARREVVRLAEGARLAAPAGPPRPPAGAALPPLAPALPPPAAAPPPRPAGAAPDGEADVAAVLRWLGSDEADGPMRAWRDPAAPPLSGIQEASAGAAAHCCTYLPWAAEVARDGRRRMVHATADPELQRLLALKAERPLGSRPRDIAQLAPLHWRPGAAPAHGPALPPGSSPAARPAAPPGHAPLIDGVALRRLHREVCTACRRGEPCYIDHLVETLEGGARLGLCHGPVEREHAVCPQPEFDAAILAAVRKRAAAGVLRPVDPSEVFAYGAAFLAPLPAAAPFTPADAAAAVGNPAAAAAAAAERAAPVLRARYVEALGAGGAPTAATARRAWAAATDPWVEEGPRLVVDLGDLPAVVGSFAYDRLPELLQRARPGCFGVKSDMKGGYNGVRLHPVDALFTGVAVRDESGQILTFVHTRLPRALPRRRSCSRTCPAPSTRSSWRAARGSWARSSTSTTSSCSSRPWRTPTRRSASTRPWRAPSASCGRPRSARWRARRALPLSATALALYLWRKCMAKGNSASWGQWQSPIVRGAGERGATPPTQAFFAELALYRDRCVAAVPRRVSKPLPIGGALVARLARFVAAGVAVTRLHRTALAMLVVAFAGAFRVGDLAEGSSKDATPVSLRLCDIKVYKPGSVGSEGTPLPHGGVVVRLRISKGLRMRRGGTLGEVEIHAFAGNGGPYCSVRILEEFMADYGLDPSDAAQAQRPLFALTDKRGVRVVPESVIPQTHGNANLRALMRAAGLSPEEAKHLSARGSRYGRATELASKTGLVSGARHAGAWGSDKMAGRYVAPNEGQGLNAPAPLAGVS